MHARSGAGRHGFAATFALGAATVLLLAACGSTTPAASAGPTTAATAAATTVATSAPPATEAPQPTGPASFQLTVTGDANVTGTWSTSFGINCNNPTLAGLDILFFAQSPDGKAVVLITLLTGSIGVSERAGAGATFTNREFVGTGVTTLDPSRGGTFDSDVTIVPTPNSNPGTLGTITHVAGSVDCGDQLPGTSTIVASGESAEGPINGPFTSARVTCILSAANGKSVSIAAVIDTATPPVYMIISLPSNGNATIFTVAGNPQKQHTYTFQRVGVTINQLTATGARIDAGFGEVMAQGATDPPHVIHLKGEATCGTFIKN